MSGCPSLFIAIDKADIASGLRGRLFERTSKESLILVLAVDDAASAILLEEGDGKKLSFGLSYERVNLFRYFFGDLAWLCICFWFFQ